MKPSHKKSTANLLRTFFSSSLFVCFSLLFHKGEMNKTLDKIDEYFQLACGSNGCVDLKAAFKLLWSTLNNSVSAVDLAGVFSISIPSNNPVEALSRDLFHDFLRAYSRLKFPSGGDFVERILEDLRQSKGGIHTGMNPPTSSIMKSTTNAAANAHQQQLLQQNQIHSAESNLIYSIADKTLIRVLLKYDLQLRRAYAAFCGQAVRVGGLVSWDEVKSLNLGMEVRDTRHFISDDLTLIPSLLYSWMDYYRLVVRIPCFRIIFHLR